MSPLSVRIKRPFIWISRFRKRRGYGVHSPFAFDLITDVIYEKSSYYAYAPLRRERREKRLPGNDKTDRLLFRLVNKTRPGLIVEVGEPSASALYLQAAKPSAEYLFAHNLSELFLEPDVPVDFLYLNNYRDVELTRKAFRICAGRTAPRSLFVVNGIGYSKEMRRLWKEMRSDERVGVTFDLYDAGLLFFDKTKVKQHYIVNF